MAEDPDFAAALAAQLAGLRLQFLRRLQGTLATFGEQLEGHGTEVAPRCCRTCMPSCTGWQARWDFRLSGVVAPARSLEVQASLAGCLYAIPPAEWETWKAACCSCGRPWTPAGHAG